MKTQEKRFCDAFLENEHGFSVFTHFIQNEENKALLA